MKVLAINTSPRKNRNTYQLLEEILKGCRSVSTDIETEIVHVADADEENFKMCKGCWACKKTGICVCGDDYVHIILEKISNSDAIIFGVPVFFYGVTAQCKVIMDRSLAYMPIGENKVVATAITCGSAGVASTLQAMEAYYSAQDLLDAGWVATYGKTEDKTKGKEVAYGLGRKLVRLASLLKQTESEARIAADAGDEDAKELLKDLSHTNHFAYGTHTF